MTGRCTVGLRRAPIVALVLAGLLAGVPATAHAGGDEEPAAPPTLGPPGPWSDGARGNRPYVPSGTRRCGVATTRGAGPGLVLGVSVRGMRCAAGRSLVSRYQRCLTSAAGRERGCYDAIRRLCVQPEFLGGCRTYDRFFNRRFAGLRCVERRVGAIGSRYDASVTCSDGKRRVDHAYTLFKTTSVVVDTETELRAAWANPRMESIAVTRDIVLRACRTGDPIRESPVPILVDGGGHTLRQGCFEKRLLRQDGTGFVELKNVTLTRGGSDGPGGAVTTRGEIAVIDSKVQQNLAEEPGGGIMSQRRATIIRSLDPNRCVVPAAEPRQGPSGRHWRG